MWSLRLSPALLALPEAEPASQQPQHAEPLVPAQLYAQHAERQHAQADARAAETRSTYDTRTAQQTRDDRKT